MQQSSALLLNNRENGHLLEGVFGITDAGGFPCADYIDKDLQNAYFEGHT